MQNPDFVTRIEQTKAWQQHNNMFKEKAKQETRDSHIKTTKKR